MGILPAQCPKKKLRRRDANATAGWKPALHQENMRDRMEKLINEMLDGRILLDEAITEFEKLYIQRALERHSDHISKTANALGIHRNTLSKRIAEYKDTPRKTQKRMAAKASKL